VFGHCRKSRAGAIEGLAEARAWCAEAGRFEADCRVVWVEPRIAPQSGVGTDELLAMCGEREDCALDVLDHRRDPDPVAQAARCVAHTGQNGTHCIRHAIQRWRSRPPTAEGLDDLLRRSATLEGEGPQWFAGHAAEVVACDRVGSCAAADPAVRPLCESTAARLATDPAKLCHDPRDTVVPGKAQGGPGAPGGAPARPPGVAPRPGPAIPPPRP